MARGEPKKDDAEVLEIDGRAVRISSPAKPYFTQQVQLSKLDIVRYFLQVAPGALRGIAGRPIVLKGRGGAVLSEAGAIGSAGVYADGYAELSEWADGG
jgi:hypothetical protein